METPKIEVINTTEYPNGTMTVCVELNESAKTILIEAGFNSLLIDSMKNFQNEEQTKETEEQDERIFWRVIADDMIVHKIGNLLVTTRDLPGTYTYSGAVKECMIVGDGWRIPTAKEMSLIYKYKNDIGHLYNTSYWTSDMVYNSDQTIRSSERIDATKMMYGLDGSEWVNKSPSTTYYNVRPVKTHSNI